MTTEKKIARILMVILLILLGLGIAGWVKISRSIAEEKSPRAHAIWQRMNPDKPLTYEEWKLMVRAGFLRHSSKHCRD